MKILFVTNTIATMSGASKVFRFVAANMASQFGNSAEVEAIAILDHKIENGIPGCQRITALGCDDSVKGVWRVHALKRLRSEIKKIKPDVICTFVSDACVMTYLAALGLKSRLISCDRGDPRSDGPMWSRLSGWAYRHSDACVFQLQEVRDFFGKENLKKSYVIPNPFVPTDAVPGEFEQREKTIVSAGRFTDQKGYDFLIPAFAKVYQKHPDYKLRLLGDGPERTAYERLIRESHLEEAVELPGFVENVPEAIRNAGIFCLSSRYEGIPNSLLEAMSLGIPAVAFDCAPGGARFLTDNGKRGLLVPLGDVDGLANALNQLIEDRQLAEYMGEKELAVRELFAPAVTAKKWKRVFDYLL